MLLANYVRRKSLILLFLVFLLRMAGQFNHNLVVISEDGKKITLYVNDQKINETPQVDVKAFSLGEGTQKIRVEFEDNAAPLVDSIHIKSIEKYNNKEFVYAIRVRGKGGAAKRELVFVSVSDLSGPEVPVVPAAPVYVHVKDNNLYGNLYRSKDDKPIFFENYNAEKKECSVKLDEKDLEYAVNLVNKTNDKEKKFRYAEASILKNCYTVPQLSVLLNLLDSEMDKLKLSKSAYTHLLDPANAKKVEDVFKYPVFRQDYNNFLQEIGNAQHQVGMNCTVAVSEPAFISLLSAIKKAPYEYERLKVAKEEAVNHCFSTAQVKRILEIFTHDREKLEFSKSAYAVVIDKQNYASLESMFQFSESKSEFKKFLSAK